MNPFEYLSILTSIFLALGITQVLTGVGKVLQVRGRIKPYWVHLVWALNLFLFLVLNWWILFRWHRQAEWTFFLFLFVLLSPIIAFLLSVLLFPEPLEPTTDLKGHFYANHRWFFMLGALLPPIDAVDTLLKGREHFMAQGMAGRDYAKPLGPMQIMGHSGEGLEIVTNGRWATLLFSPTGLLLVEAYAVPGGSPETLVYNDYRPVGGSQFAFEIKSYVDQTLMSSFTISEVQVNPSLGANTFNKP